MGLSIVRRLFVCAVVLSVVLSALVLTVPLVQAATWTVDTDTEFGSGTLTGLEIVGTGAPAYLQLLKEGMDWKNESPASDPGVREGPAMAYDSTNDVVVLFGGYDGLNLNDTWEYSPGTNTWTPVSTATAPSPRAYSAMAFDSINDRIVLFGGVSDLDFERDTWEYNALTDTWQETTPGTSPPQAASYHLAFVSSQSRVVFIGKNLLTSLMETWSYNTASDLWENRAPSGQPTPRTGQAVAYDSDLDRVVLFGGFDSSVPPGTTLGDTWEYDMGTNLWIQTATAGPSARTSGGLTYWSSKRASFLYGGRDGAFYYVDTWRYPNTAGNRQWEAVSTQRAPSGRILFGISDETSADKSFVYGGRLGTGPLDSDTWSLGPAFLLQGTWVSDVFDSGGANVDWNTIAWAASESPPTTVVRFQLATSNDPAGPWNFYGPGGSISAYYAAPSPQTIWTGHDNQRYMKIFAQLYTLDNLVTPTLDSITIDYTVAASNPYIIWTDPYNMQPVVPTDKLISIRFSEAMNTGSVTYDISPTLSTTPAWSESDSRLTLNHVNPLQQCKVYTVTVLTGTDLGGNPLIAGPVPNPFTFSTVCVPPEITSTTPIHGTIDVALDASIVVDFSEAMNTTTVQAAIVPNIALTPTWSNGDTRVTYAHPDFQQCMDYTVNVTGKDLDGSDLIPGAVPNPWSFRVVCTTPYVVSTSPYHYQIDVAVGSDINVTFSEPMDTATVQADIFPSISLTPTWSNGDKTVTYTHPSFSTCTAYTVNMTGKDLSGNDLWIGKFNGFAENPWFFVTACANPYIVFTSPADGETDVDRLADITVQFSEAMDNATVTWDLQPTIPLNASWDVTNTALFLTHTDLFICGVNQITITGKDTSGNDLQNVLAPNPWIFTPLCPNPYVVSTDPANNSFGVPLMQDIVVTFSEPMNTSTLIHSLNPPDVTLTPSWSSGNTVVTLSHVTPFNASQTYQVFVDGADVDGFGLIPGSVPNPWWFSTAGALPYIVTTDPPDGAIGVPLTQDIVVTFSEAMNTGTVSCGLDPPGISLAPGWSGGDTILTLSHATPFAASTLYTVTCTGQDLDGNGLVAGPVPNPWSFTTVAIVSPEITNTEPQDGAIGVPLTQNIVVTFSEAMNTGTVSCGLDPPGISLAPGWSAGDTVLTLSHATPFAASTLYTVTCTGQDLDGNDLVPGPVPNPWSFTTVGIAPPDAPGGLQVEKVPPSVVRLTWTIVPGADSYNVYESTDRFAAFPWAVLGTSAVPTFDANHLADGLTHYYIVRAVKSGIEGANSTMGVKIDKSIDYSPLSSNIYWFSLPYHSSYALASDISTELTSTRISVVAKWNPATQTPILWYYFRGMWRGTDFTIGPGDGLYIGSVSAFSWVIVGTDADVVLPFTLNTPPNKNVNWLSIPYTGIYSRASDISDELASLNITEIGLWNPLTQTVVRWFWTGSTWTGTDFAFSPGDGIYIIIASDFNWQPVLITPEVT